jgi:hypothetical protein
MSYNYLKIVLPKFRLSWCVDKVSPILSKMVGFPVIWTWYSVIVGNISCCAVLKKVRCYFAVCAGVSYGKVKILMSGLKTCNFQGPLQLAGWLGVDYVGWSKAWLHYVLMKVKQNSYSSYDLLCLGTGQLYIILNSVSVGGRIWQYNISKVGKQLSLPVLNCNTTQYVCCSLGSCSIQMSWSCWSKLHVTSEKCICNFGWEICREGTVLRSYESNGR